MLMIDLQGTTARISIAEILSSGKRFVSNPVVFGNFAAGLKPTPDLLLDTRWQVPAGASKAFAFFQLLLHEILPSIYDVRHLEAMGGRFSLRLTGVGDYTVTAFNRRVLTFKGLPLDEGTGAPVVDAEMRPDVFMALCNELIAKLSETTLISLADNTPMSTTRQGTN